jgi:hypothetical protein
MANHERDVRAVLKVLQREELIVDPKKAQKPPKCSYRATPTSGSSLPQDMATKFHLLHENNGAGLAAPLMNKL